MILKDRAYQTEAVNSIWEYFRTDIGNPVVAMPTGTGKSVVIARFCESVLKQFPNQKILVLTHVKELIEQNCEKFMMLWPEAPAGIFSAGLGKRDTMSRVIFGGIASVARRPQDFGHVDLILIDECHLVSQSENTMYRAFINFLLTVNPYLKVIGFTATPWRLGHGVIIEGDSIFTDFCFDITGTWAFNRLIAEGFLCPLIPKRTKTELELDGVHIRGGEFIPSELQKAVDLDHVTRAAIGECMEYVETRKCWLIFASGIDHANHIHEVLQEYGLAGGVIHNKVSSDDRRELIRQHKSGEIQYIVNNNVLTTGYDNPRVDMIVCLRPTMSPVLWVQILGRGTRVFPGKNNCLILDFAGNTRTLGPINDPKVPKKKGEKGGPAPVKCCERCNTYQHPSVRVCQSINEFGILCGFEFSFDIKLNNGASSAEVIKGDLPIVESFKVDAINYSRHDKVGKPPSMCVSYFCGRRRFQEWVSIEHGGSISRIARDWVFSRLGVTVETTEALLALGNRIPPATHIKVWVNQKYPRVMNHCFDGTNFGTEEDDEERPESTVQVGLLSNRLETMATEIAGGAKQEEEFPF